MLCSTAHRNGLSTSLRLCSKAPVAWLRLWTHAKRTTHCAQSALCSVTPSVLSTVLCSTTVFPGIHCCCGCGSCFCCCCHFGGVAQQTFLQKWHAPNRQSQLLQRGVLCPWAQLSDGIHVAAMQSPSPESVSQKRPVTWPHSTQARSKSDSSPYANTST